MSTSNLTKIERLRDWLPIALESDGDALPLTPLASESDEYLRAGMVVA